MKLDLKAKIVEKKSNITSKVMGTNITPQPNMSVSKSGGYVGYSSTVRKNVSKKETIY